MIYESERTRQIFTDGRKHPSDPDPSWLGYSVGTWEKDTLVVDTVGFNDRTWLDEAAHVHTEKLHLIERYKRIDGKTLRLDMTIDDPGAYTKPFNSHRNFTRPQVPFMQNPWVCSTIMMLESTSAVGSKLTQVNIPAS